MPKRVEALVKPELLRWARRSAHLDLETSATKAGVSPETLESWESGFRRPSVAQLRNLGKAYGRPLAIFYLPEPPTDFDALRDFRRIMGPDAVVFSHQLATQMRDAQSRQEFLLDLYEDLEEDAPQFTLAAEMQEDPERVASRIRTYLHITSEVQTKWRSDRSTMNGWRNALEVAGIPVFQMTDVEQREASGFSIHSESMPIVVVNVRDVPYRRTFTMLHELAHLALRQGGLCDLQETPRRNASEDPEVFCNAVAGAALVPESELLEDSLLHEHPPGSTWSDEDIGRLSRTFGCSREVVVRRLLALNRVTNEFYQAKRRQYQLDYFPARPGDSKGGQDPARKVVSNLGSLYVRTALNAYHQEAIHAGDLAELLGMRLKHLNRIEGMVAAV